MSTPAIQPHSAPSLKQEVNLRLAAHKNRNGENSTGPAAPPSDRTTHDSRAAQAAARVAARFAQAPSYSQMLADEARAAVRAAEAASHAALHAQAAAESVLAGLEAASGAETAWEPKIAPEGERVRASYPAPETFCDPFFGPVEQHRTEPAPEGKPFEIRWEPDMPVRAAQPERAAAPVADQRFEMLTEGWPQPAADEEPQFVEPAQPIHANLIEFPRELVAPRKARPRIAEGPFASSGARMGQLSIFEVDPGAISIEPAPLDTIAEPVAPDWSRIQLDAEPEFEPAPEIPSAPQPANLPVAPMGFRLMAGVVDGALIAASFLVAALVAAVSIKHPPSGKTLELAAMAALLVAGVLYQALFFTLSTATPGMRYAGVSLCTFDGQQPGRAQLRRRLGALILSMLPVGLGALWAIFDEEHLSWHDRLSQTYQRRG